MSRVATLTLNPTIDLETSTPRVMPTHKLRCTLPRHDPGGGGINVARVASILGSDALAVYPAGGTVGEVLRHSLDELGLAHRPVAIAGETRESLTVNEAESGLQYRFVLPGPALSGDEQAHLLHELEALDPAPAFLVVSGSFAPGVALEFFDELVALSGRIGARLVIDFSGEPLAYAAQRGGAYLMKPSLNELSGLLGRPLVSERQQEDAVRELIARGSAEVVVLSLGSEGALYACGDRMVRLTSPQVPVVSAVGAGDSMLGAIVHGLANGLELSQAVRYGVAAGAATVMRPGTELCRREDVEKLLGELV